MPEPAAFPSSLAMAATYGDSPTQPPPSAAASQQPFQNSASTGRSLSASSSVQRTVPPEELVRLLSATGPGEREEAWAAFTRAFSRLLLHTARWRGAGYDEAMDRYAYILQQLRCDDCRRLRGYVADGRGKFTTWLVVVARRLCLDYERQRYGRFRETVPAKSGAEARRRLVDLVGEHVELECLSPPSADSPEGDLRAKELRRILRLACENLSARDQLLLKLRFEDELSAPAIARLMGFRTPFHVYRRLNCLQRELRAVLVRRGIRDSQP